MIALWNFSYWHDDVLMSLLSDIQSHCGDSVVYADIDGYRATNAPLATILPSIITTSYHPDIAIHYGQHRITKLLELTFPFNTTKHLHASHERKSTKPSISC